MEQYLEATLDKKTFGVSAEIQEESVGKLWTRIGSLSQQVLRLKLKQIPALQNRIEDMKIKENESINQIKHLKTEISNLHLDNDDNQKKNVAEQDKMQAKVKQLEQDIKVYNKTADRGVQRMVKDFNEMENNYHDLMLKSDQEYVQILNQRVIIDELEEKVKDLENKQTVEMKSMIQGE